MTDSSFAWLIASIIHLFLDFSLIKFNTTCDPSWHICMQLDDWVLCRIYKKTSQVSPMAVPPLSDHELDEPSGAGACPMSSAGMIMQGGAGGYPLQAAASGTQRMPKIPSISELLNEYSLAQLFDDSGHALMARHDQHAALFGHPIMGQFHVNSGGNNMSQLGQMDSSASTSVAGEGAAGKRKRPSEDGDHNRPTNQPATAVTGKKPNSSCLGATTFQTGNNTLQGSLGQGHQTLLHF
uniref:Uncharacterized protein n=1 Tax=Aegilops tauschii subsp. strangulata TaxID=200361 RepID=A0A453I6F0_AEGTS